MVIPGGSLGSKIGSKIVSHSVYCSSVKGYAHDAKESPVLVQDQDDDVNRENPAVKISCKHDLELTPIHKVSTRIRRAEESCTADLLEQQKEDSDGMNHLNKKDEISKKDYDENPQQTCSNVDLFGKRCDIKQKQGSQEKRVIRRCKVGCARIHISQKRLKNPSKWLVKYLLLCVCVEVTLGLNISEPHTTIVPKHEIHFEKTIRNVASCPSNASAWNLAAQIKKCQEQISCSPEECVYHCVVNARGDGLVEVCHTPYLIQAGYCPELNSNGIQHSKTVKANSSDQVYYPSNEVYNHPECLVPPFSTSTVKPTPLTSQPTSPFWNWTTLKEDSEFTKKEEILRSSTTPYIWIGAGVLSPFVVIFSVVFLSICCKKVMVCTDISMTCWPFVQKSFLPDATPTMVESDHADQEQRPFLNGAQECPKERNGTMKKCEDENPA